MRGHCIGSVAFEVDLAVGANAAAKPVKLRLGGTSEGIRGEERTQERQCRFQLLRCSSPFARD
eukprot:7385012-Prymnesium_polylepis.1